VSYHLTVLNISLTNIQLPIILYFMFYARWTRKGVPATTSFVDKLQLYVAEWASRRMSRTSSPSTAFTTTPLGSRTFSGTVPTEDANAGDVRACYPATATCPGPRRGPAGRGLPGALRLDRRHSSKLRYCKHITFI
jgi:hypothetical protein